MFVRFQGSSIDLPAGSGPAGFAANYSIACGGTLVADATVRSLESAKTTTFSQCDWIISSQNPSY